jgi:hypothetical protein
MKRKIKKGGERKEMYRRKRRDERGIQRREVKKRREERGERQRKGKKLLYGMGAEGR